MTIALQELEDFVMALEDYGPAYYDIRDQIALKSQTVQLHDTGHILDKVTHLDQVHDTGHILDKVTHLDQAGGRSCRL